MSKQYFGAIELGGTKTNVLIADGQNNPVAKKVFPTLSPTETVTDIARFIKTTVTSEGIELKSIGVGSFGPLDLHPDSKTFGFITTTPKLGWEFFDIKGKIESALDVHVEIDTDVNAAALGEFSFKAMQTIQNLVYITIGTGIGAGFIVNGELLHGLVHPEFGHIRLPHDQRVDPFPGICPYHRDCFEGLASGPALAERWRMPADEIPQEHVAWDLEGEYIAYALSNLICTVSPEKIILGGGVMHRYYLYNIIRAKTVQIMNNYIPVQVFGRKRRRLHHFPSLEK
jgi:Transcriptional regulator/sugar kinase